jgi:AraC-like DNA-binding protein
MNRAPAAVAEIECFFSTLPPPKGEMERRVLTELHDGLASTRSAGSRPTPSECARQLLIDHYCKPWTLSDLAKAVGSNRTTLQEQFQLLTHTTVHQFLVQRRVSVAQQLLKQSDIKVSCVAHEVGYLSQSAFARHFKRITGVSPRAYRKSSTPAELRFSTQSLSNAHAPSIEDDSENRE